MEHLPSPAGYVLEGHEWRAASGVEFARWWVAHPGPKRAVAQETLPDGRWLSTVFLGHDHNLSGEGPPLLFETMLFRSEQDVQEEYCERYATWDEAAAGHEAVLRRLRAGRPLYDEDGSPGEPQEDKET